MSQPSLQVPRRTAVMALVVTLMLGAGLAAVIHLASGKTIFAAEPQRVPIYLAPPHKDAKATVGPTTMGFAAVVKPVLPAVVNISTSRIVKTQENLSPFFSDPFFRRFFGNQFGPGFQVPKERREMALGSGVIVSPDGYILTNNHVIDSATDIKVFLPDKREFKGHVVGRDPKTDIALVKIKATGLPTVTLGDSSKLQVGDLVLAIGDPFGVGETVTHGIVSATGRRGLDIENYEDFIQTDAPINPGNSGGALINMRGELVGINTAITSSSGGSEGIGFAIPINLARYVMDQILQHGKVIRGWLGVSIQDLTPALAKGFGIEGKSGALIGEVLPNGPAAKAGIKRSDVIVGLNGQPISGANDLRLRIGEMSPGKEAHLKIIRDGKQQEITVKLGEMPENGASAAGSEQEQSGTMAGVKVETLTPEFARQHKLPSDTKGVLVDSVDNGSAAQDAGVQSGDVIQEVNRKPISDVSDYEQAVQQAGDQPTLLLVNRGGNTLFVVVQPK